FHFLSLLYEAAASSIYTLSLHDALPIWLVLLPRASGSRPTTRSARVPDRSWRSPPALEVRKTATVAAAARLALGRATPPASLQRDRKSTRLNSSHVKISYAVFCLKKKTS